MEFVFVVPRAELFRDCYPQGFLPFDSDRGPAAFLASIERAGFFVERAHAEKNPELKQVIPYSVVVSEGQIFLLQRTARGGEARLHDKLSIGVGGHINPEDALAGGARQSNPIAAGSRRELGEELELGGVWEAQPIGLINDDSNPVGAVHVGWVQIVHARGAVSVREHDVLRGRFASIDELSRSLREGANFETWSARLVEYLDRQGRELLREPAAHSA